MDDQETQVSQEGAAPAEPLAEPADSSQAPVTSGREVAYSWQASEYVHHHKGLSWYAGLAGILIVLLAIAVLTKQWLSIAVFAVMGAAIAVYANKPPRVLTYELDGTSIAIEGKVYPYKTFRSFSVMRDAEWHSIDLEPTQRFMPRMTLLFADDDYDTIVSHLDLHLPQVDRKPDVIERLSRYLRF